MQLEAAATVGVVVILTVLGIIVKTSVDAGLPAIKNGELPLWTFQVSLVFTLPFVSTCVLLSLIKTGS